ncbi:MAG: hypothetical protein ACXAEN_21265 [Candidatus Thorarchaeota archaeon]|jgi:hypothetical protein
MLIQNSMNFRNNVWDQVEFRAWVDEEVPKLCEKYPEVSERYSSLVVKVGAKKAGGWARWKSRPNDRPLAEISISKYTIKEHFDDAKEVFRHEWAHIVSFAHRGRGHSCPVFLRVCRELNTSASPRGAKNTTQLPNIYWCKACGREWRKARRYRHHKLLLAGSATCPCGSREFGHKLVFQGN